MEIVERNRLYVSLHVYSLHQQAHKTMMKMDKNEQKQMDAFCVIAYTRSRWMCRCTSHSTVCNWTGCDGNRRVVWVGWSMQPECSSVVYGSVHGLPQVRVLLSLLSALTNICIEAWMPHENHVLILMTLKASTDSFIIIIISCLTCTPCDCCMFRCQSDAVVMMWLHNNT